MSEDSSSLCSTSWLGRLNVQRRRYSVPSYSHRWLVVLASHLVHVIVYGTGWTVGVWNSFFLDEFGQSAALTAWIGSILNSVMLIVSFGTSFYIERLGCRNMIIAGRKLKSQRDSSCNKMYSLHCRWRHYLYGISCKQLGNLRPFPLLFLCSYWRRPRFLRHRVRRHPVQVHGGRGRVHNCVGTSRIGSRNGNVYLSSV
jgi:hypothetical protein